MTQEDKELLLRDLSARLSYNLVVQIEGRGIWNLRGIDHDDSAVLRDRVIVWHGKSYPSSKNSFPIINCKPFLFPLSSMSEEQKKEFYKFFEEGITESANETRQWLRTKRPDETIRPITIAYVMVHELVIDWLNKHHFDYHGLIEKGLAIDATNLNIY